MLTRRNTPDLHAPRRRGSPDSRAYVSASVPRAIVLVLVATAWAAVAADTLRKDRVGLRLAGDEVVQIQDFASQLQFSRAVLGRAIDGGAAGSAYTPAAHLGFMRWWTGCPQDHALPFGYSPTMLWLLAVLFPLSLAGAYVAWTAAGYAATAAALERSGVPPLAALLFFLSPVAMGAVALGRDCSPRGGAGLLYLASVTATAPGEWSERGTLATAAVLWALTAKGRWRWPRASRSSLPAGPARWCWPLRPRPSAPWSAAPFLGTGWPRDYLVLLGSYSTVGAGRVFASSLHPGMMSDLRALLAVDLSVPDPVASAATNAAFLVTLATVLGMGVRRRLGAALAWALATLAYLLLASHVTFTEDLALLVVATILPGTRRARRGIRIGGVRCWPRVTCSCRLGPGEGCAPPSRSSSSSRCSGI